MTTKPRILILHTPAGGGHKAAAHALAQHAEGAGAEVEVHDALASTPKWFARGYVRTHLGSTSLAPALYGFGYDQLNRRHPTLDRVRRRVDRALGERLLDVVAAARADVVIATHFYPLSVLGAARLSGRLDVPLIGVVTDYTAHAFWAEPGVDAFCCAPGSAASELSRHGAVSIVETGIPVRREIAAIAPPAIARVPQLVRVLMTSGGHGIGPLEQAIASFAGFGHLELTVVCGADDRRRARAQAAADRAHVDATIVGFERDMPARLAAADVVVGKAGGLTVSEALACGRPMVLFGTCPGQEEHNEAWLELHGAAVTSAPERVGARIEWLRRNGNLPAMARAGAALGRPHAAADIIAVALASRAAVAA